MFVNILYNYTNNKEACAQTHCHTHKHNHRYHPVKNCFRKFVHKVGPTPLFISNLLQKNNLPIRGGLTSAPENFLEKRAKRLPRRARNGPKRAQMDQNGLKDVFGPKAPAFVNKVTTRWEGPQNLSYHKHSLGTEKRWASVCTLMFNQILTRNQSYGDLPPLCVGPL